MKDLIGKYLELDKFAALYMDQGMDENDAYERAYEQCESDELEGDQDEIR